MQIALKLDILLFALPDPNSRFLQKEPVLNLSLQFHILSFPLPGPNSWIANIARAKRQQCLTSVHRLTICSTASFGQVVIAINL